MCGLVVRICLVVVDLFDCMLFSISVCCGGVFVMWDEFVFLVCWCVVWLSMNL